MRKGILSIIIIFSCLSCTTYQIGGTYELRDGVNKTGGYISLDGCLETNILENTFFYFPKITEDDNHGFGYDFFFKYPIHLFKYRMTINPMAGVEGRVIPDKEDPYIVSLSGKFGGSMDLNLAPVFFLRGAAFYLPEITSSNAEKCSGFRFNASIGFRTRNDPAYDEIWVIKDKRKKKDPRTIKEYFNRGNEHYDKKEYDSAIADYNEVVRRNPRHSEAYYKRGSAYHGKKDYDRAITDNL